MGRVLRRKGHENVGDENFSPKAELQKSKPKHKTTGNSKVTLKTVLSDRTNFNPIAKSDKKEKVVTFRNTILCENENDQKVNCKRICNRKPVVGCLENSMSSSEIKSISSKKVLRDQDINMVEAVSDEPVSSMELQANDSFFGFTQDEINTSLLNNLDKKPFLGFDTVSKSPSVERIKLETLKKVSKGSVTTKRGILGVGKNDLKTPLQLNDGTTNTKRSILGVLKENSETSPKINEGSSKPKRIISGVGKENSETPKQLTKSSSKATRSVLGVSKKKIVETPLQVSEGSSKVKRSILSAVKKNSEISPKINESSPKPKRSTLGVDRNTPNPKIHLPVYKIKKPSPEKQPDDANDRLHLYDFEIDENEPVVKKKRKPILKIKRCRTYNRKKKEVKLLPPLNFSNQENICPNTQKSKEKILPRSPLKNKNTSVVKTPKEEGLQKAASVYSLNSSISERSFGKEVDNTINDALMTRQGLYSPPPYESPKRESLSVPVLRTSVSENDYQCPKSLNVSASSSRQNTSMNSAYSGQFASPLYLGSSTPIRSHWTEQSTNISRNASSSLIKNFDLSNNFGFEDDGLVEEPFVSPIKVSRTPAKPLTSNNATEKIPLNQVVRMLKFGPDAPEDVSVSDESQSSNDLFRDSISFSPPDTPPTPVILKKNAKHTNIKEKVKPTKKKKVVIKEDMDDSDFVTQSSEDTTCQEPPKSKNNRTLRKKNVIKEDMNDSDFATQSSEDKPSQEQAQRSYEQPAHLRQRKYVKNVSENVTDTLDETHSINKNALSKKENRRSYERAGFLRHKKYDSENEEEEAPEVTIITTKAPPKKKNAMTKKEEMEMEKWARAFNEQCMQVESFNLVVE